MEGGEGRAEMRREMGEIILKKHPTLHLPSSACPDYTVVQPALPTMFPQNDDPTTFIRPGLWLTASQQGGREENNCILPFISYSAVK